MHQLANLIIPSLNESFITKLKMNYGTDWKVGYCDLFCIDAKYNKQTLMIICLPISILSIHLKELLKRYRSVWASYEDIKILGCLHSNITRCNIVVHDDKFLNSFSIFFLCWTLNSLSSRVVPWYRVSTIYNLHYLRMPA